MIPFTQLVATVLEVSAADVGDETGPGTHPGWTSIKHLQLIVAIEENYSLSFSREEIRSMRSIGDFRRSLATKGVAL
jgi:acyl carrier protein